MAANTLTNFLVGIGWDTTQFDQGTKQIHSSMGSLKSTILQTGVALGAIGAGVKFAASASQIDNFTRSIGVGRSELLALGGALEGMGGSADSAMGILTSLEQKRASLLTGETGWIATAARAGIDTRDILSATDAMDAFVKLADQFHNMTQQQRLNAAEALGLDPATVAFLSQGRAVVDATIETYRQARPPIDGLTEASRELTQEWSQLEAIAGGLADKVESKMIPAIAQATIAVNRFLQANKAGVDAAIDRYATPENIDSAAVAVAGAGVASTGTLTGAALAKLGLTRSGAIIAGASRLAGGVGVAYGVSDIAARAIDEQMQAYPWYQRADIALTKGFYDLTGLDISRGNVYEGTVRESLYQFTPPESAWAPGYGSGARPQVNVTVTPQPLTINAHLEMDGRAVADKVMQVTSDQNRVAIDDLQSTTER